MSTLSDTLLNETNRKLLLTSLVKLVELQVSKQRGISGALIKTIFNLLKNFKEGFLEKMTDMLLPDFTKSLNPFYEEYKNSEMSNFEDFLLKRPNEIVKALLSVTDNYITKAKSKILIGGYKKLRGKAEKLVGDAVPGLVKIIAQYAKK
jgi:hypothetical protein